MWQAIFTGSVHSSSYDFSPMGQILWPSSWSVCHENKCARHNFSVKKKLSCVLFCQQVPIHVCCVTNFHTHTLKMIQLHIQNDRDQIQMTLLTWYLTQILTSDEKEQPVTPHKRVYKECQKTKQMEGNAQDCNKDKVSTSDHPTSTHLMAWRKQMGAINTRNHQFTGDKTGERQNLFTS